jgi:mannose-6-phosphate isomerase-like protein (cupin superfamily)
MAEEILENPVTGETMRILESTPETFTIEYALRPHGEIALEHFHPNIEQEIAVRSGEMHITVNGEHMVIKAGESVTAPPSAHHFQWNPGDIEAIAVEKYRPAGRNHDFFRTLFGIAQDGFTNPQGMPSLLLRAAIFSEYKDTIRPVSAGSRLLIAALSPISRVLGYRRRIEKYAHQRAA